MQIKTSERLNERLWAFLAIVGAALSFVGWLRFFRIGLL
jgi:hypothetical protein